MSSNVREFTLGVRQFADESEDWQRDVTRAVALRALRGVVMGTRVDTGRARGNWQVEEGSRPQGYDSGLFDQSGGPTIARGATRIAQVTGRDIVWLHNGVPYITFLEDKDKMVEGNARALEIWLDSQR